MQAIQVTAGSHGLTPFTVSRVPICPRIFSRRRNSKLPITNQRCPPSSRARRTNIHPGCATGGSARAGRAYHFDPDPRRNAALVPSNVVSDSDSFPICSGWLQSSVTGRRGCASSCAFQQNCRESRGVARAAGSRERIGEDLFQQFTLCSPTGIIHPIDHANCKAPQSREYDVASDR